MGGEKGRYEPLHRHQFGGLTHCHEGGEVDHSHGSSDDRCGHGPVSWRELAEQVCCWGGASPTVGCQEPALPGRLGCREHIIAVEARDHEPPVGALVYDRNNWLWQRRIDKWVCVTQEVGGPPTRAFVELLRDYGPVKEAIATGRTWGA